MPSVIDFEPETKIDFQPEAQPIQFEPEPENPVSLRAAISPPGEVPQLAAEPGLPGVPQAFPAREQAVGEAKKAGQARAEAVANAPLPLPTEEERKTMLTGVAQPEAEIQPIGEEGTVLRGASSVVAGVLNRPEYLAAMLNPATAAAVGIRFAPEIVKQFVEDVGKAVQGDNEAFGRAAVIGIPALAGAVKGGKTVTERLNAQTQLERAQAASSVAHVDALARLEMNPRSVPRIEAPAPTVLEKLAPETAKEMAKVETPAISEGPIKAGEVRPPTSDLGRQVREWALDQQRQAGWDPKWPFIPQDLGNPSFRDAILSDPTLSAAEKTKIFDAAERLGVTTKETQAVKPPISKTETVPEVLPAEVSGGKEVAAAAETTTAPPAVVEVGGATEPDPVWRINTSRYLEDGYDQSSLSEPVTINIADIEPSQEHGSTKPELVKAFKEGKPVTPVVLERDSDGAIRIVDGSHRINSAEEAGVERVQAQFVQYADGLTRKEAVERGPESTSPGLTGMGGATPYEFAPTHNRVTGIKNASVDLQRAERGLPPIMKPMRETWGDAWDRAMAKMDADPLLQDNLIRELKDNPRAATTEENVILTHRLADLRNELDRARREEFQARDDGRLEDAAAAQLRGDEWSNQLSEVEQVTELAGTWAGRNLAARKILLNDDFTLAKLEQKARSAMGEENWSNLETRKKAIEEARATADKWQQTAKELETKLADKDKVLAEEQMARSLAEMQAASARQQAAASVIPPQIKHIVERVGQILDERADAARKRLQGKLFSLSPDVLKDLAEIGASNIYHVGYDLAKWSARMVEDLGERVRPHLDAIYEAAKKLMDDVTDQASGKDSKSKRRAQQAIRANDTPGEKANKLKTRIQEQVAAGNREISGLAQRLARAFVEDGIKDLEALIDAVHEVLAEEMGEGWSRRDTMDAVSGYGSIKLLRKDEVSLALRDLKGQMQQMAKLEDMAAGEAPRKTGLERRIPSDAEKELIKLVNEAKKKGGYTTTDPETQLKSAVETVKARTRTQIKELERRLAKGDFAKRTPSEVKLDNDALTLRHKLDVIKREWFQKALEWQLSKQSALQKTGRRAVEVLNVYRAIRASFDLSAVLRQGKFTLIAHPIIATKAIPEMLRALRSEKEAFRIDQEILERPNYPAYKKSGLYLSEHGASLAKMEEAYMSRWAEKIPLVAASQRAYTTFLNKLRADTFDLLSNKLGVDGVLTKDQAKVASHYINVSTGRGSFGGNENIAVGLNTAFFAPRFVMSRFQMAIGQPIWYGMAAGKEPLRGTASMRRYIAFEYGKILTGYAVFYALANAAGYKVEFDSNSPDFGKIVLGKTRIDPLAGVSQAAVFLSRNVTGQKKKISGQIVPIVGKVPYGQDDLMDVWKNFLRSKAAPAPGLFFDWRTGQNMVGEPFPSPTDDPVQFFLKYIGPISMADIQSTIEANGVPTGMALTILSLWGESIQTYDQKRR